jgi:hypothetical protein
MPGIAAQPDNSIRVALEFSEPPITGATVFYLSWQGTDPIGSYADVASFVGDIAALWATFIHHAEFASGVTYHTAKTEALDALSQLWRVSIPMSATGLGGSASKPGQVAYLVNFVTPDPRRGGKSRWYLPGVDDASLADIANLTTTARTNLNGYLATLISGLKALTPAFGSNVQLVEMSFYDQKAPRVVAHEYEIFTGTFNPVVATQRRRIDRLRA